VEVHMEYVGDGLFPARAEDLRRWLEGDGPSVLGEGGNHWLAVIEYSGHMALTGDGPAERQDFRGVALLALSEARRRGVLSVTYAAAREINLRVAYLVRVGHGPGARDEAKAITDALFGVLPFDLETTREHAADWAAGSWDMAGDLRTTKNLLRPIRHLREHLDDARLRVVDQWLDLLPLLP
jgi:hypothetical protein